MKNIDLILTTTNNLTVCDNIVKELLLNNLATCVQIDEVKSFYKWEGKLEQQNEFRIMIKANLKNYSKIEQKILSLHNYSLPEIVRLNVTGGLEAYLNWINN